MKIYYIYHSGFIIETEESNLIFDYYKIPNENRGNFKLQDFILKNKNTIFFSSHNHGDHFNKEIFNWENNRNVYYILSDDIEYFGKEKENKYFVKEGDVLEIAGLKIRVFGSSDEGVSFYVETKDKKFFHSGDLNWWYWPDDTKEEEVYMETLYKGIVDKIKQEIGNETIDYLFCPVDPRLEKYYSLGAEYIVTKLNIRNLIPMHMWDNYQIINSLKEKLKAVTILKIEKNCEKIIEIMEGKSMVIRMAKEDDVKKIAQIELECFPIAEAAEEETLEKRYQAFKENFIVAEVEGKVIGFINGCTTDKPELGDELYHDANLHKPDGDYQTVFGLDVLPEYRNQGIAEKLLNKLIELSKERGKKGMILTCKDHLVHYYSKFGFEHKGVSASSHGGAKWNDMYLDLLGK